MFSSKQDDPVIEKPVYLEERTEPKCNKIDAEPIMAMKDGHLIMVVQHQFSNIPSWVEWDNDRHVVTITQMNGDIDEAGLELKDEHLLMLKDLTKLLLVSNDNEGKMMHYVQFIARVS